MKKIHVILGVLFLTSACALSDIGRLNSDFLNPLNNILFVNEFQVNDPQYLFDASNKTVAIKSKTAADTVNGIYQLELIANPASDQGIYRLTGTKGYNNFFLGIQYSSRGSGNFGAKIVVQNSELTASDALNSMTITPYVNSPTLSHGYYRVSTAGTWARVSSTGIYNASISEHFTFNFNEGVDAGTTDAAHSLLYVNISGAITNSSTYSLTLISNISSSSVIYFLTSTNLSAPLVSRYIGVEISSISNGVLRAKIVTSTSSTTMDDSQTLAFATIFANTTSINYTTLSSVERPDAILTSLRTKGPWVFASGNVYDQLNTTNWDFSLQDQSVTITAFGAAAGSSANVPITYALQTTSVPQVFRFVNTDANATLHNKYFTFKFRTPTGSSIERASFYLEDSIDVASARLTNPSFTDNYVNIYSATLLGGGTSFVDYKLRVDAATITGHLNFSINAFYGATVFTRSESGIEYIYILGGSESPSAVSTTSGMYEVVLQAQQLRGTVVRTANFGTTWETINFSITNSVNLASPFAGQTAWVGDRLFIYNPAKYSALPDPDLHGINANYRIISTTNFAGQWDTATLPSDLTNRPHAAFFSSQGILTLIGGLHHVDTVNYTVTNDVWQSYNGGSSWAQVAKTTAFSPRYMATVLTIGSEIYLLGGFDSSDVFSDEIWKSTDNGLTWTQVEGTIPSAIVSSYDNRRYGRMGGFVINNALYIVGANISASSSSAVIYSSKDGGKNWKEETQVDTTSATGAYDSTFSREANVIGSSYVWSVNNTNSTQRGVWFNIGGIDRSFNTISSRAHRRVLRSN